MQSEANACLYMVLDALCCRESSKNKSFLISSICHSPINTRSALQPEGLWQWVRVPGTAHATWHCHRHFLLLDPECGGQDSVAQEEPPAQQSVSSRPAAAKLSSTIYTETVQFLLQNSALQVKAHIMADQPAGLTLVKYKWKWFNVIWGQSDSWPLLMLQHLENDS